MTQQTNQAKLDPAAKLGWGEKFGYAAGDMASCLYFGIVTSLADRSSWRAPRGVL